MSGSQGVMHIETLVRAFVLPRYHHRLLRDPEEVLDVFCHVLIRKLDPKLVVPLEGTCKTSPAAVSLLQRVSPRRDAFYLGAWHGMECGEYPLDVAIEMVESYGGAAAVIEPGEVVYYKSESCPRGDRYLLVKDAKRREAAAKLIERDRLDSELRRGRRR